MTAGKTIVKKIGKIISPAQKLVDRGRIISQIVRNDIRPRRGNNPENVAKRKKSYENNEAQCEKMKRRIFTIAGKIFLGLGKLFKLLQLFV